VLTFSNFILITYRLLIEKVSSLQGVFTDLWVYVVVFIIVYIPAAIAIGHWHRKTQLKVEMTLAMLENPIYARAIRVLMDLEQGTASETEVKQLREMLLQIERKYFEDGETT